MSVIALGIDPSLTKTGYCILKDDLVVDIGLIKADKYKGAERLHYLHERFDFLVNQNKFDIICIEGYSFGSKGRSIFGIGEMGGVLRLVLHESGVPWIEVAPATLKKFATGSGVSEKDQVMMNVYKRWNVECANNNEADAFVLAMIGHTLLIGGCDGEGNSNCTVKQKEVLKLLRPAYESKILTHKQGRIFDAK